MKYLNAHMGTCTAQAMPWGEYGDSLPEEKRRVLRHDPFNRTDAEIGLARMNGQPEPANIPGFLVSPDGSNVYIDPAQRWIDAHTFKRTFRVVDY